MHQPSLFQLTDYYSSKWYNFQNTELGRIYNTIPWESLGKCLPEERTNRTGPSRWFGNAGFFGVMFLKHYTGLSDEKLVDRINTDWAFQLFCGLLIEDNERIRDKTIVSRIRGAIAKEADLDSVQNILIAHWKGDMANQHTLFMDASCFESYIRFPTDVKLLWESCQWVFEKQIFSLCKELGIKRPRSKYRDQEQKQLNYSRRKKKTYKQGKVRRRSLLYLLEKGLGQLEELHAQYHDQIDFGTTYYTHLSTIKKVLEQQQALFDDSQTKIEGRIVSLHKPYVRPIKRGKENKSVEFGMKVHMLQVDGVDLIDIMSFKNFNECTRLKDSIVKHKQWFEECHQLGADRIYATNENRRFITENAIFTNFPRKGKNTDGKEERELRKILGNIRSTHLEGSFGNHKNHYQLRKVKAHNESTEKVWVFFGVMTANAVNLSKRKPPGMAKAA